MSNFYEIVTFTAALKQYSDQIVEYIDPLKRVAYQLSRKQCNKLSNVKGYHKDLSMLGRDLRDVIIIDNTPQCFELQPENGIQIIPFYDDPEDKELIYISAFLKFISLVNDVRPIDSYIDKFVEEENIVYLDKNLQKQVYIKMLGKNKENTGFLNSPQSEDQLLTLQREQVQEDKREQDVQRGEQEVKVLTGTSAEDQNSYRVQSLDVLSTNFFQQHVIVPVKGSEKELSEKDDEINKTIQQDLKEVNISKQDDEISKIQQQMDSFSQIRQQKLQDKKVNKTMMEKIQENVQISMYPTNQNKKESSSNTSQTNKSFKKLQSNVIIQFDDPQQKYGDVLNEIHTDRSLDMKETHTQCQGIDQTTNQNLEQIKINPNPPKQKKDKSFLKINDVDIPKYRSIILGDDSIKQSIDQVNLTDQYVEGKGTPLKYVNGKSTPKKEINM